MHNKMAWMLVVGMMGAGLITVDMASMTSRSAYADSLNIDSLSSDAKQFRRQVEQLVSKTDDLIGKLKGKPDQQAVVLDLMQTRDDILRELPKVDSIPGDAQWTAKEMVESVQSKLKLLKEQYDEAVDSAS